MLCRSFFQLVGDLGELKDKTYYEDVVLENKTSLSETSPGHSDEWASIKLENLEVVTTLGVGGFGRVELVKVSNFHILK